MFPTRLGIILSKMPVHFLIANIWLQLGWKPPCEVSKNLADLVPLALGMESFIFFIPNNVYSLHLCLWLFTRSLKIMFLLCFGG
jgi:hypothetical protein